MKHLVMIFTIFWMSIGSNWAQSDVAPKVPKKVIQTFQAQYKVNLEEVSWEEKEELFIAQFWDESSESMLTIHYDNDGKKIKTISELSEDALSNGILSYLEKNLSKSIILASYKITLENDHQFLVEVETDKEYISILFSSAAKVLKEDKQVKSEEVEFEEETIDDDD